MRGKFPQFSEKQIIKWARVHFERFGRFPSMLAGQVIGAPDGLKWSNVNDSLMKGRYGLPGGETLRALLRRTVGMTRRMYKPVLSVDDIIAWGCDHFSRTGKWPTVNSGKVLAAAGETWSGLNSALGEGMRGLPGKSSIAKLFNPLVGPSRKYQKPPLDQKRILQWAHAHRKRTGKWPASNSGSIPEAPGESWFGVHGALVTGKRGMKPGRDSLSKFLHRHVGKRPGKPRRIVRQQEILRWADEFHRQQGRWPSLASGLIPGQAHALSWEQVDRILHRDGGEKGRRWGLAKLLETHRGGSARSTPRVDVLTLLEWIDSFYQAHGSWPTPSTKRSKSPGMFVSWYVADQLLRQGRVKGVKESVALAKFLADRRGVVPNRARVILTEQEIIEWAKEHHRRTGRWPTEGSTPLRGMPATWRAFSTALKNGRVGGVPQGSSLRALLSARCGVRPYRVAVMVTDQEIIGWAKEHHRRTGRWPTEGSDALRGMPASWVTLSRALKVGRVAGVPKGSSLRALLLDRCGARPYRAESPLTIKKILEWADAYHDRTGRYPRIQSIPIPESPGDSWQAVSLALQHGRRSLPGGETLAHLLARERGVRRAQCLPPFSVPEILRWAAAYHRRTGRWPHRRVGPVHESPLNTWEAVNDSLRFGYRSLPKGSSLYKLFARLRGDSADHLRKRRLTVGQITSWATAHYRRNGEWPDQYAGRVADAKGETWFGIAEALRLGARNLPKGLTLKRVLAGLPTPKSLTELPRRMKRVLSNS
ncbi:MAG TPA: hypothetical protein VNT79_12425 [Phycisphaerae bacterium]|nr:hypothetical protein [Phycisphaerae bacterium]